MCLPLPTTERMAPARVRKASWLVRLRRIVGLPSDLTIERRAERWLLRCPRKQMPSFFVG